LAYELVMGITTSTMTTSTTTTPTPWTCGPEDYVCTTKFTFETPDAPYKCIQAKYKCNNMYMCPGNDESSEAAGCAPRTPAWKCGARNPHFQAICGGDEAAAMATAATNLSECHGNPAALQGLRGSNPGAA